MKKVIITFVILLIVYLLLAYKFHWYPFHDREKFVETISYCDYGDSEVEDEVAQVVNDDVY